MMLNIFSCANLPSVDPLGGKPFVTLAHFITGLFALSFFKKKKQLLSFESSLYVLDTSPLSHMWFVVFSPRP